MARMHKSEYKTSQYTDLHSIGWNNPLHLVQDSHYQFSHSKESSKMKSLINEEQSFLLIAWTPWEPF
uniref:Uncharacterized protein n=1 Tax=Rhizophora mucronata TaxID=61149 RepID=A0A2P2QRE1_RHIMU